jgi:hypothetical protein
VQAFTAREALEQRDIKSAQLMKWIAVFSEGEFVDPPMFVSLNDCIEYGDNKKDEPLQIRLFVFYDAIGSVLSVLIKAFQYLDQNFCLKVHDRNCGRLKSRHTARFFQAQ